MYKFIDEIDDPKEIEEQIKIQHNAGIDGYFKKEMIKDLPLYQKVYEKRSLEIITPQQTIFVFGKKEHEPICIPLLEYLYGREFRRKPNEKKYHNDLESNMMLGNIYIKLHDNDVELDKSDNQEHRVNYLTGFCYLYFPKTFSIYQFKSALSTLEQIKQYDKLFWKTIYGIVHYLDDELKEYNCYMNDEIYDFLGTKDKIGIANEYIRKIPILPEEKIIFRAEIGEEVR